MTLRAHDDTPERALSPPEQPDADTCEHCHRAYAEADGFCSPECAAEWHAVQAEFIREAMRERLLETITDIAKG